MVDGKSTGKNSFTFRGCRESSNAFYTKGEREKDFGFGLNLKYVKVEKESQ